MSYPVFCHRCSPPHYIAEATEPVRFAGLVRVSIDRLAIPSPRGSHRCDKCGWWTIVEPATSRDSAPWREVHLKRQA